jgi:lipopolysaccharide transport system ATP-binding protein
MTAIKVKNLSKTYKTYRADWQRLAACFGFKDKIVSATTVLKDISFDVEVGECVGIVGINGAGKSTLLKIISGTLAQTNGFVTVAGRVSAILELGLGFNQELSGRQNAIHSAELIGFTPGEIQRKLPEIAAFAEIGDYWEKPVRLYSSGMQVRLAFAVATAWRPDLLIVDEALAVGDAYFSHKSFSKIREFRENGTSILLVSHDKAAIQSICDRAILLHDGKVVKIAKPEEVIDYYNALLSAKSSPDKITIENDSLGVGQTTSGTGEATVEQINLLDSKDQPVELVSVGERLCLRISVRIHKTIEKLVLGYSIKDRLGQVIYGTNTWHTGQTLSNVRAGSKFIFEVFFPANFGPGSYSIQTALVGDETHMENNFWWRDRHLLFTVLNKDKVFFVGCSWNEPTIKIQRSKK